MEYYKNLSLEDIKYIDDNGVLKIEEWRDIPNYVGFYQVSDLARVKSLKRTIVRLDGRKQKFESRILRSKIMSTGYLGVALSNTKKITTYTVHQLVAISFLDHIPCRYNKVIDHKNNNKLDNRLKNLNIVTQRINISKGKKSKSTKTCVYAVGNKFRVSFIFEGKTEVLGTFDTLEYANHTYKEAIKLIDLKKDFSHLKKNKVSATGIKYVYFDKGKFRVIFSKNYVRVSLGTYKTSSEAKKAYDEYLQANCK